VAKSELGTKRVCPTTGRKFYDLGKDPVISPYTGEIVPIAPLASRQRVEAARASVKASEADLPETEDAEFVSLEEADVEAQGPAKATPDISVDDDIEIEDDGADDDTFIEEEEDSDDDVTDIIGDVDTDEET